MKRSFLFFGLLAMILGMVACGSKSQKGVDNGEFVPQKDDLKVTLDIGTASIDSVENVLQCRLAKADLGEYMVERTDDGITVYARLDDDKDQPQLLRLLTANANIEFWETYAADVIVPLLHTLQTAYAPTSPLSLIDQAYNRNAIVALAHVRDTASVNRMLRSEQAQQTLPGDLRLLWGITPVTMDDGDDMLELFAIRTNYNEAPINGRNITSAKDAIDQYSSRPVVELTLDNEGSRLFARLTKMNVGRAIAIVMDNTVYTAPIVNGEITGGLCTIAGNFSIEDTRFLASILNSGWLPQTIRIRSCDTVL